MATKKRKTLLDHIIGKTGPTLRSGFGFLEPRTLPRFSKAVFPTKLIDPTKWGGKTILGGERKCKKWIGNTKAEVFGQVVFTNKRPVTSFEAEDIIFGRKPGTDATVEWDFDTADEADTGEYIEEMECG